MAILTYLDLQRYMNKTFTAGQQTAATTIIAALERELSYYINRPLSPTVTTDEIYMLEPQQRQIFLRKGPVVSVASLEIGLAGDEVAQTVADYDIHPWGIDNIYIASTGYRAIVTYTAGMASSEAQNLERIVYSAATREMSKLLIDAQGIWELDVEGTDYKFSNMGKDGFTEEELRMASRYKRRVIR